MIYYYNAPESIQSLQHDLFSDSDNLSHAAKGEEMANHKYSTREWVNGKWVYKYGEESKSNKKISDDVKVPSDNIQKTDKFQERNINNIIDRAERNVDISRKFLEKYDNAKLSKEQIDQLEDCWDMVTEYEEMIGHLDKAKRSNKPDEVKQILIDLEWTRNELNKKISNFQKNINSRKEIGMTYEVTHGGIMDQDYLMHYGIKGQKWGERRFQNPDGSLTPEGIRRYNQYKEKYGEKTATRLMRSMNKGDSEKRAMRREYNRRAYGNAGARMAQAGTTVVGANIGRIGAKLAATAAGSSDDKLVSTISSLGGMVGAFGGAFGGSFLRRKISKIQDGYSNYDLSKEGLKKFYEEMKNARDDQ